MRALARDAVCSRCGTTHPGGRRGERLRSWLSIVVLSAMFVSVGHMRATSLSFDGLREGPAVEATTDEGVGSYRFLYVDAGGRPIRWDPCEPIRYVVNTHGAPYDTSLDDIRAAFDMVTDATGVRFEYLGPTDERPREAWSGYGGRWSPRGRWAPVLVVWTDPDEAPDLTDAFATAGPVPGGRPRAYVTGAVHLNRTESRRPAFGPGSWGNVLLHEAGHLMGLTHVDAGHEMMGPVGPDRSATERWGIGDREGLRQLGRDAGCLS